MLLTPRALPSLLAALLLLAGCQDKDSPPPSRPAPAPVTVDTTPDTWPATSWQTAAPESQGFPAGAFDTLATDAAAALPYHTSLLVIRNGWLLHESYHDTPDDTGNAAGKPHHVWSITKSVTAMTLGRAMTRGDLVPGDLDTTVDQAFPANVLATLPADDGRRAISLRQVLQMRSGLAWNEGAWLLNADAMKDPVLRLLNGLEPACPTDSGVLACAVLQRPLAYAPGTVWNYNTYDSYLASVFFTLRTEQSLNAYAVGHLLTPIGVDVSNGEWSNLPDPYTFGGGGLYITSRDLARLGMLMLYDGNWNGEQLLSPDWITLSTTAQGMGQVARFDDNGDPRALTDSDTPIDIPYGLQWWRVTGPGIGGTPSLSARGLGGQMMHIFKDKELIIIITCDDAQPHGREPDINNFLKTHILDKLGA